MKFGWCGWWIERAVGVEVVCERWIVGGGDWGLGFGTTSGASAEFIVIVRVWPSAWAGLELVGVGGLVGDWRRDAVEAFGVPCVASW
jgi:hypothetical protein